MSVTENPTPSQERISLADLPDVMNVKELAAFLGVSEWSVREQVDRKEIPSGRIGTRIVFLKPDILKYLGLSEDAPPPTAGKLRPARVFLLHPLAAGIQGEMVGLASAEGAFLRFRRAGAFPDLLIPAQAISWVEFLPEERQAL